LTKGHAVSWTILVFAALCDCFTLYIIKWRSQLVGGFDASSLNEGIEYVKNFVAHPFVWIGLATFCIGLPLGYIALTRLSLTVIYPVNLALHLTLSLFIGVFLLGEELNLSKIIGIILILISIYLITKSKV
jgi:multidrug transporter EmrE-like cation transporter